MKKFISIILTLAMLLAFTSCGDEGTTQTTETSAQTTITTEVTTDIVSNVDYSKIKFVFPIGAGYYTESPQNREEFIEYLENHRNRWYGCDDCRLNIKFASVSKIPLDDMYELNIPFEYNYIGSSNSIEIKYGVEVDIEAFADCIERISQKITDSVNFSYHWDHPYDE